MGKYIQRWEHVWFDKCLNSYIPIIIYLYTAITHTAIYYNILEMIRVVPTFST